MRTLLVSLLLAATPGPVFTVSDPRIDEASGMVDLGAVGTVVANDSGDEGRVFLLDDSGATVGVTAYGAATDVEALAPAGPDSVWVGDIGDNAGDRDHVEVRRVQVGRDYRSVDGPSYRLVYPDGPHDAEALMRHPTTGRPYVVTKVIGGGAVYEAPAELSSDADNELARVGEVPVWATDGAFLGPDRVVVRGYATAGVFSFPGLDRLGSVTLPAQPQGESLSVGPGGRVRIGSEGVGEPVVEVDVPADVRGTTPSASPTASPSPSAASDRPPVASDDGEVSQGSGSVALTVGLSALAALLVAAVGTLVVRRRR